MLPSAAPGALEKFGDSFGRLNLGVRVLLALASGGREAQASPRKTINQPQCNSVETEEPGIGRAEGTLPFGHSSESRGTLNGPRPLCLQFLSLTECGEVVSGFQSQEPVPGNCSGAQWL